MTFSSIIFLFIFLPAVLAVYFIIPPKFRNFLLLISSLVFYAWGEPKYIVIMVFTILLNYVCGIIIGTRKAKGLPCKSTLVLSVIVNIGILGFFKYSDFFITNINGIFGLDLKILGLALPIGISFYTFQTMSYTIDVYRGEAGMQKNIIDFAAYVTMFPQLIAGPIVKYRDIADRLKHRKETLSGFSDGILRFCIGLGKKVLLANGIGHVWDTVSVLRNPSVLSAWLGAIAFAFQIYFDFSGYSDMAIGMGKMLGFEFLENFNYPYMSKSITEFWRRWHISLGTWFREYVYIPLGGNRKGLPRQILNLLIVWALTGFWHGASWNFICWGLYFGIILIVEKLFLLKGLKKAPAFIGRIYTLVLVIFSWVIFAIDDIKAIPAYICSMFGAGNTLTDNTGIYLLYTNALMFIVLIIASTDLSKRLCKKIFPKSDSRLILQTALKNVFCIGVLILSVASLISDSYNPFLYFRF